MNQAAHTRKTEKSSFLVTYLVLAVLILYLLSACAPVMATPVPTLPGSEAPMEIFKKPLVTNMYTADPSAHVFEDKIYIYPSHDLDHDNPPRPIMKAINLTWKITMSFRWITCRCFLLITAKCYM